MSAGKSSFVPNSFQTPNDYVDEVMPYLTGEEYKVLIYATRRILGFQKRQDRISISQFTHGTKGKEGNTLDSGTGLGIGTVKNCLANLVHFGLMVRVAENDPRANEGTLWSLQWDSTEVNWKALEERAEKWDQDNANRIKKARSVRQTGVCETEPTPASETEGGESVGLKHKTQYLKPSSNTEKNNLIKVIAFYGPSVFGNNMTTWWNIRRRLDDENIILTGDEKKITIKGLCNQIGQFTEAEVWQERYGLSFSKLGLELEFQP